MENSEDKSSNTNNTDELEDQIFEENEIDSGAPDVNILRERTFNKELSDLVSKIRTNESIEETAEQTQKDTDKDISDDELLRLYHKLYYKTLNLEELDKINSELNPFDLYKESSSDEIINLINTEMSNMQLSDFSILAYIIDKNAYTNYANYIANLNENNIVIDSFEILYTNILSNTNGFIVDSQIIERNLFLNKRFGSGQSMYFISFGNFFMDFFYSADLGEKPDFSDQLLPILLIQLKENIKDHQKKSIYNNIKNRLTVYFFLLYKKILLENQNLNNNISNVFNLIDYTYKKYSKLDDYLCCIIKFKKYVNIESFFILQYLQDKLEKKLFQKTSISRIEKDKLIIFAPKTGKKILEDTVDEFNKVYNNVFDVKIIMNDENNTFYNLQNIKNQILKL